MRFLCKHRPLGRIMNMTFDQSDNAKEPYRLEGLPVYGTYIRFSL